MLTTVYSSTNANTNGDNYPLFSEIKTKKSPNAKHHSKHTDHSVKQIEIKPNKQRRDAYGTRIVKGSKRHKVSFIDIVSLCHSDNNHIIEELPLVEVIDVCSYKAYNEEMSYKESEEFMGNANARCCDDKCLVT